MEFTALTRIFLSALLSEIRIALWKYSIFHKTGFGRCQYYRQKSNNVQADPA
jgi:hypothetical protein